MAKKPEKRKAQLVTLKQPVAMSLVEKPANRAGFKVVRSDETEAETKEMTTSHHTKGRKPRKKTKKRDESLYMIKLPDGISREEADQMLSAFAMTEDYDVIQADDGSYWFQRKNIANFEEMVAGAMTLDMGNGFQAVIDPAAFEGTATRKEGSHGVSLVELTFDGFDIKETKEWLDTHGVDFKEGGAETVDGGVIVTRREFDPIDGRKVTIGDGVTGVVVRAAENDVPEHLYRQVIEESYGNYGWGLLDFAQYLAAPYYADATWDGIYALREVLENVTLYSGLPLDERMRLVDNALDQFGDYFKALIEAMPREAVSASQRFDRKTQEADMAKQKVKDDKVETRTDTDEQATETRSDDDKAAVETTDTEQTESREDEDAPQYITKAEVADVVKAAVTEALAAARTDEGSEENTAEQETEQRSDVETSAAEKLAAGVETVAKAVTALAARFEGVETKLDSYGESVEARSDSTDEGDQETIEKRKDPFEGMFASLQGLRPE